MISVESVSTVDVFTRLDLVIQIIWKKFLTVAATFSMKPPIVWKNFDPKAQRIHLFIQSVHWNTRIAIAFDSIHRFQLTQYRNVCRYLRLLRLSSFRPASSKSNRRIYKHPTSEILAMTLIMNMMSDSTGGKCRDTIQTNKVKQLWAEDMQTDEFRSWLCRIISFVTVDFQFPQCTIWLIKYFANSMVCDQKKKKKQCWLRQILGASWILMQSHSIGHIIIMKMKKWFFIYSSSATHQNAHMNSLKLAKEIYHPRSDV